MPITAISTVSAASALPCLPRTALAACLGLLCASLAQPVAAQTTATPAPATPPNTTEPAAAAPTPALERVEILGGRSSDTEERRQSTASKIVIGREELDRQGDSTVADVLKRLPGVTIGGRPGRGGEIRMRGLGSGYTQILVNGERVPYGFSLDSLTPEQIERIEVMRAPTAETGAQAIAGTINIVLRENVSRRLNNLQLGAASENGQPQLNGAWTRADKLGAFSYNLSASAYRRRSQDHSDTETERLLLADQSAVLLQHQSTDSQDVHSGIHLGGRMQWRLDGGDTLVLMPFLMHAEGQGQSDSVLTQPLLVGTPPDAATYATSHTDTSNRFTLARLNGQWQTSLNQGGKLELKAGTSLARSHSGSERLEFDGTGLANNHIDDQRQVQDTGWSTGGKYSHTLDSEHSIGLGWEADQSQRTESRSELQNGLPQQIGFGEDLSARTRRGALWAQDEWNFNPQWSAYAGLRWEGIGTYSAWDAGTVNNQSSVWSPLLHSVWKLNPQGSEQIRASLTRSYRAPTLNNLVARPLLSNNNSLTDPDRLGNPQLKPELATGIDLAFEHYLSSGGLMSASLFHRQIADYMRTLTTQGADGRWVAQPFNIGNASSSGIELEAKFRASELLDTKAAFDVRTNLSLFKSQVEGVPGPNNRLDSQPRASANLGADYRLLSLPLTIGGNLNWTPGDTLQLSEAQRTERNAKRVIDVYALWAFNPNVKLRASAANLLAADQVSTSQSQDGSTLQQVSSVARTYRTASLRVEWRL
jgi:iron complex outermembrane receptor protein